MFDAFQPVVAKDTSLLGRGGPDVHDTTRLPDRRQTTLADLVPAVAPRDVVLVLGGAALVGALAQVTIRLSFTPVLVTGQTLGVLVGGCALGWRHVSAALAVYVAARFTGLPCFNAHLSGWQGPSTGYLFGFVLAAGACGWLSGAWGGTAASGER